MAQNYEKIIIDKNDSVYGYYLAVKPASNNIQGVMVLLPGFGSPAESILPGTKLHNVAYVNDILTIIINTGQKLYIDDSFTSGLDKILTDVIKRYSVEKDKFIIGGHSAGGTLSLRYAELCAQHPSQYPIQPKGVFSVDGPADLVGLYHYFEREIKKNFSQAGVGEAVYIKGLMDKELGPLQDNLQKYAALSPFVALQDTAGNEKYLRNMAVRVYHDVDIVWMLQNRRRSVYDMNVAASTDLINQLLLAGNNMAEFVPGQTGYLANGMHHPHSWTIVEETGLVQWVKKTLQFFPEYAPEPYNLPAKGWNTEKAKFPLDFAPSIPYKGIDDIRFLPGFYNDVADDFWSYCFLWYLDGDVNFTETVLKNNLITYYNGLNQSATATTVTVKNVTPANGYAATFECVITTIDKFVTHKPITLNATVNIKPCTGNNKTMALFSVSPQPLSHSVWQKLNGVRDGLSCNPGN
jgi:pimeloyl-ACP methyl ester carboxylesterase